MRGKVFTAAFILDGAYKLATEEGISAVTARGLSREMGISTQPIYMEFKNINNLRTAVYEMILEHIETEYFSKNATPFDFMNNFYRYIKEEHTQYISLTTDKTSMEETKSFFYQKFCEALAGKLQVTPAISQLMYAQVVGSVTSLVTVVGQFNERELIKELYERTSAVYSSEYFTKVLRTIEMPVEVPV
ncbi:hypothetical protein BAU15_07400 [Enterococcus sp. JM4C]|uniref:TetR/AcrR family transcriptional regulator n=1 Tax=Candidatus Enterococcus huntleyi TaxID=1857217 RepID=UPI00137A38B9|nr:TetR family transcriptional regulator [Enterococcus sp. JM4C]KAF1297532.1 hypothetical protein BAU15_07400 [Enterococcus sp. JM4C]